MIASVIKVGGSLSRGGRLEALCQRLAELGQKHRLLVVPGGGDFADTVRHYYRRYRLSETAVHWMSILAMDQYGYLLSDLIPDSAPVRNLAAARDIAAAGRVPVLLPFDLLRQADPLPHSWAVTADSIAAWVARSAGVPTLILLKDVDGLYTADPRMKAGALMFEEITLDQLAGCAGVDRCLASLLSASRLDVWAINGEKPERLAELLATSRAQGTRLRRSALSSVGPSGNQPAR